MLDKTEDRTSSFCLQSSQFERAKLFGTDDANGVERPANDSRLNGIGSVDLVDDTRSKLASFELLKAHEELDLALELQNSSLSIAGVLAHYDHSARELALVIEAALSNNLSKSDFRSHDGFFALRSELKHLANDKENSTVIVEAQRLLQASNSGDKRDEFPQNALAEAFEKVDWSGPLMVAIAKRYTEKHVDSDCIVSATNELLSNAGYDIVYNHTIASDLKPCVRSYLHARETLVKHNLRLVFHIAKRYSQDSEQLFDLIQEGTFGLMRAAEKYRPATGYRFSTYAYQWIESKIRRARANLGRVISISYEHYNDLIRLLDWQDRNKALARQASTEELLAELAFSEKHFDRLTRIKSYHLSLDSGAADGGSMHAMVAGKSDDNTTVVANERSAEWMNSLL